MGARMSLKKAQWIRFNAELSGDLADSSPSNSTKESAYFTSEYRFGTILPVRFRSDCEVNISSK